jgi:hypothetical protein
VRRVERVAEKHEQPTVVLGACAEIDAAKAPTPGLGQKRAALGVTRFRKARTHASGQLTEPFH